MSLYNDASLVMIPSAYKDGKLYSIKPTDGSGDFTFSRGSNLAATRVDENGLIEKGRENVLLQSNQFDTSWSATNVTLTSGQSGVYETNDAWKIQANADGVARIVQSQSISANTTVTISIYAKSGNADFIKFTLSTTGSNSFATFDLTDGTVVGNQIDDNWQSIGNGWVRISATFVNSIDISQARIEVRNAEGVADAGDFAYIQHAQLEYGLVATDYIETTTTTAQAGILEDMPRLDYSGGASCPALLLEPQRSNLFTYSEYIDGWSTSDTGITLEENAVTSPEGVANATKIKEDGTNAAHAARQLTGPVLSSGTDYAFSFFAKKAERSIVGLSNTIGASNDKICFFDLDNGQVLTNTFNSASIEDFGNGWYRCIAIDTADANDDYDTRIYTATADNQFSHQGVSGSGLYIYGLQLESGSYPTSYIPCYGAATTRSVDGAEVTSASSIIGQTQGVLFFEFIYKPFAEDMRMGISDGTSANYNNIRITSGGTLYALGAASSVLQYEINAGSLTSGQTYKVALKYNTNDIEVFVNGVSKGTDTSASPAACNRLGFDNRAIGQNPVFSDFKQAVLFPTALTDSECIALTQ